MPGRRSSTGRLRSKTSDLSDLLRHGSRPDAKQHETHLTPPVPPLPEQDSATKAKHKISFFARRRKSSSVSPSSAKSTEARTHSDADAPPLPKYARRLSTSKGSATRSISTPASPSSTNSALPSSLPPLNVSSSSFGSISQLLPSNGAKQSQLPATATDTPQKSASAIPVSTFRHLRPQKSTSFEFGRRSNDNQTPVQGKGEQKQPTGQSGGRPIITVSAPPPSVEDDEKIFTTPRTAPPPPLPPLRVALPPGHIRSSRRDFRDSPESCRSDPASSVGSTSPATPQSPIRFPVPPSRDARRDSLLRYDLSESSGAEEHISGRTSASSSSSTRETLHGRSSTSTARERVRRHPTALPLGVPRSRENTSTFDVSRSAPESGLRTRLPDLTTAGNTRLPPIPASPPPRGRIPASASYQSSLGRVPPPLITTFRRAPNSGPPTEPLPSPPPLVSPVRSAAAEQSRGTPPMAAMPTIPSIASRISVGQVHQLIFRSRANTLSSRASTSTGGNDGSSSPDVPLTPIKDMFMQQRNALQEHAEENGSGEVATVEQLREALNAQSAKYKRLSSYLLTLTERHSLEKSELMRRIEALERDARKREREITGLRWLVMNAGQRNSVAAQNGTPDSSAPARPSPTTRFRSTSKSSHGHAPDGANASPADGHRSFSIDSTIDSMEEGLFELQKSVSDLIAPLLPSPPGSDVVASPVARMGTSPSPSNGAVQARIRRANTLPDALSQFPPVAAKQQKQARRTSSPVFSAVSVAGLGLDIDLPSIPSLNGTDAGHLTPVSSGSALSSLPSLTAANTASSGLSVIPETPRNPKERTHASGSSSDGNREGEEQKTAKEEKRRSRSFKRLSASSTSSSVSAAAAGYSGNLKLGSSPSIGQVLDRATDKEPHIEAFLRKLRRSYGSG